MKTAPRAAAAVFPYPKHRTVDEIWGKVVQRQYRSIEYYEQISRQRELTEKEVSAFIRLVRKMPK